MTGFGARGTVIARVAPAIAMIVAGLTGGCSQDPRMRGDTAAVATRSPHWVTQDSGTAVGMRGVCAVSRLVAWVGGADGTCLHTLDGGESWQAIPVPDAGALDFRDIHALDARTAWLLGAGEQAKIFYTRDGGRNWIEQYVCQTPGAFFDAFAFWDERRGIAFSDPVAGRLLIIVTADGGATWEEIDTIGIPPALPNEHGFAASGTSVVVQGHDRAWIGLGGAAARVMRSTDGGHSWSATATPIASGRASTGVFSLAFHDARHGVVVGGDYENPERRTGNAAMTTDGGATWRPVPAAPPAGYRSAVAYVPNTGGEMLVAVGPTGSDYSTDGGRSWTPMGTVGYHAVSFAADGAGWAVGADGRIAKYSRD